jgi:biotin carboxylase
MITGIDLIQEQIKVAQGQKLSFTQDDIKFKVRGAAAAAASAAAATAAVMCVCAPCALLADVCHRYSPKHTLLTAARPLSPHCNQ